MVERKFNAGDLTRFRRELVRQERSAATVEKYLRDVGQFGAWLQGRAVTPEAVAAWKRELLARGYHPATVNGKLAAVNALFRQLGWEGCRARSLRLQRRIFREERRELTRAEYLRLVRKAREQGRERLSLLLETICGTGIRVSEVHAITVEAAACGCAEIALKGKIRTILLPGKLCRKLLHYARKNKIASGEIFLARGGNPLSRKRIWAEMKSLCAAAGVAPDKVFPHNLRHLFAREFYTHTRDVVQLADILGHSSLTTTRIYLISTGAEHRRKLEQLHLVS
ncbi:MAG: tyrosine-type recombinase/integrase [Clostridia bacterium]